MSMKEQMQNVDSEEIEKFAALAAHWWDESGELKTLHQMNPLRLAYINEKSPLSGKKVADIGCGGGILSESMARSGAQVTGVDMNKAAIETAKLHLLESKLEVEYLTTTAEALAKERPGSYDMVTCLEMLEHVPDPHSVIQACATLLRPGGSAFFSTINRNPKSYLFAIIGAEYILKLLPKNTHDFAKFIRPSELSNWASQNQLSTKNITGMHYNPFAQHFSLNDDVSVNYLLYAIKNHD